MQQHKRLVRFGSIERLVYLPVLGALLVMCITLTSFSVIEHGVVLERIRAQLGVTVAALADFNELAQMAPGDVAQRSSAARGAAIWRALLAYPTASIWVETGGTVSGGSAPVGDLSKYVLVEDARPNFIVHAALPRVDALADWRRSQWQRAAVLLVVSIGFVALANSLSRALRQRAAAQSEAAAARERVTQLALHRAELEQTVAQRTRELKDSNALLEKELIERKAAEDKIAQLARTDGLTGLANRATFIDRLRQAFSASRRGASSFAILYIDLDHFKDVNDTLGHPVGDLLLREVAERLKYCTRESDVIARLGGDEFAVLQLDISDASSAGALASKLQQTLAQPYSLAGNEINIITASIGVCPYSSTSSGPDTMVAQADLALYRSKEEGRNQYHFHSDDLDQQVQERVTLAEELKKGLEREELMLLYQPQVAVVSGKIVGMEALVRWNHPVRGLLRAGAFIPIAEKAGLTVLLGQWVLNQACRQMRQWRDAGIAPPVVAINLSLSQIKSARELVRAVEDATRRWSINPRDLEFDVTEAILAQVTLTQNDVLAQLRGLGSRIAIDDFGTEYSSFEYLRAYDVSQIKIAQRFINDAGTDPECAATVRAIMNIARELNIGVIAEGVETQEQRALLASCGSESQAQGHYFSEAVDPQLAGEMLRAGTMRLLSADAGSPGGKAEALAGLILELGSSLR